MQFRYEKKISVCINFKYYSIEIMILQWIFLFEDRERAIVFCNFCFLKYFILVVIFMCLYVLFSLSLTLENVNSRSIWKTTKRNRLTIEYNICIWNKVGEKFTFLCQKQFTFNVFFFWFLHAISLTMCVVIWNKDKLKLFINSVWSIESPKWIFVKIDCGFWQMKTKYS